MRSGIVFALALAFVVSGCNKKAEGQTVAIVNNEEITAAELNAQIATAKLPPGLSKEDARTRVLQSMIDRRLLAQQAKKDGIDKSAEFLNRQRQATEELLIRMLASRQMDTAQLPSNQQVERFEVRFELLTEDWRVVCRHPEANHGTDVTEYGVTYGVAHL